MQGTVSRKLILVLLFSSFVSVGSAATLDVTGYASILGTYTDANGVPRDGDTSKTAADNAYEHDYADKYVNFTHRSRVGLQFNSEISKDFDFHLTLLMRGNDNYQTHADWFYGSYHVTEDVSFRFGRLKVPFFMVSNYVDVGHAYPWVTPPQEVYASNLINSADGVEFVYETELFGSIFLFNLYAGSSKNEDILAASFINDDKQNGVITPTKYKSGDKVFFDSDSMVGTEISFGGDQLTVRFGYTSALIDADDFNISGAHTALASVGLIIDWHSFVLYSEYIDRDSDDEADVLFADQVAGYVTMGYRFAHVLPYVTFASIDKGKDKSEHSIIQTSITGGFRYEINDTTDFKFEVSQISPDSETGDVGRFGLFDKAVPGDENPLVFAMSLDILF